MDVTLWDVIWLGLDGILLILFLRYEYLKYLDNRWNGWKRPLKAIEPKHFDEAAAIRALKFRYENHKIKGGTYAENHKTSIR